jgi:dCTP deaminase
MPLTASAIKHMLELGRIVIDPFDDAQLNPNSYNVRLGNELGVYIHADTPGMDVLVRECFAQDLPLPATRLDCRKDNPLIYLTMPETGVLLHPGKLYLGATVERTETPYHIPVIDGRSSLARLGVKVHVTGGFGDIGFKGHWTLEIEVTEPVRIYPFMQFAQIGFHEPTGSIDMTYDGKYQGNTRPTSSRIHKEIPDDSGIRHCAADHGDPEAPAD